MSTEDIERSFPPYYLEHRERYTQGRVTKVGDRPIWVLENLGGWSVNSIVIEGDDGLIVYDTGVTHEHGQLIAEEIRTLSDKPIRAIVYSHHHADHCQGTDALVSQDAIAAGEVRVIAWSTFTREYTDENTVVGPIMGFRAAYQYGAALPAEELPYTGIGGTFFGGSIGTFVPPTETISQETEYEIAGVRFTLFLTGGEAASEIGMYLPDHKTAVIADEVYVSMPNLYTLRGAKFRDAMRWGAASERVLEWDVEVLLGCHMPPLEGRSAIEDLLTTYRDAIQFNHDQAIRHILRGATAEELRTGLVELPDHLDVEPFTREMYGSVAGNAAQQMVGYLGWFSGDATELAPTPRPVRGRRIIELMGGRDRVLDAARASLDDGDPQWCAELAGLCVSTDTADMEARGLKAAGLRTLGYAEQNALRRNFYLTGALELEGALDPRALTALTRQLIFGENASLSVLLEALRFGIDPGRADDERITVNVALTDADEAAGLEMRHSVLLVGEPHDSPDAALALDRATFSSMALGDRSWSDIEAAGDVDTSGDAGALGRFMHAFDLEPPVIQLHVR